MTRKLRSAFVLLAAVLAVPSMIAAGEFVASSSPAAAASLPDDTFGLRPSGGFLDAGRLASFEQALGREVAWYVGMAGRVSPDDMRGSVRGQLIAGHAILPTIADRMGLVMTVPLTFGKGSARTTAGRTKIEAKLTQTANGAWDDDFRVVAQMLVDGGYPDAVIRLGHEFTGGWYPWSAQGNAPAYIAAYRRVHQVFAQVSGDFRFEWNAARNTFEEYGPDAYPGDDYVDVVGLDVYYEPWKGDPDVYSDDVWTRRYLRILETHRDFAIAHDKPVSYAEWAVGGTDEPEFVSDMYEWFSSLADDGGGSLLYHAYFSPNKDLYDLEARPATMARFVELFGAGEGSRPNSSPTTTVTTEPTTTPTTTTSTQPGVTVPAGTPSTTTAGSARGDGDIFVDLPDSLAATVDSVFTIDASIDADQIAWRKISGPAMRWVVQDAEDPQMVFRQPGAHVLYVSASRGDERATARLEVTVSDGPGPVPTTPTQTTTPTQPTTPTQTTVAPDPADDGGELAVDVPDRLVAPIGERFQLSAQVPDGAAIRWDKITGPSMAWSDKNVAEPVVRFNTPGTRVLRLRVSDGDQVVARSVTVEAGSSATPDGGAPTTTNAPSGSTLDGAALLSVRSVSAKEGSNLAFKIVVSEPVDHPIVVDVVTSDLSATGGVDYTERQARVVVPAGTTRVWFGVPTTRDRIAEGKERMRLTATDVEGVEVDIRSGIGVIHG